MAEAKKMQISDEIAVDIRAMNKWYGTFHVLRDINMTCSAANASSSAAPPGRVNPR